MNNFDNLINVGLNGDAEKQIGEIIKGEEDEWPLDVRDGSIAALLYLVNEGSVSDISIVVIFLALLTNNTFSG